MPAQVLTQHNSNSRTGINQSETALTIAAVGSRFHKLFEVRVDPVEAGGPSNWASQIVAQPLFVSGVTWSDGTQKDVLIVATMHGTVYAFDAKNNCSQLWAVWLGPPVLDLTDANGQVHDSKDLFGTTPEWGILSTPAIDPDHKTVYAVMWHGDNGGTYRLHALGLVDGQHVGQPQVISGAVNNAAGHPVTFNPVFQKQRPGLLLLKPADLPPAQRANVGPDGALYIAFGASIETGIYNGWVFKYDVATLNRQAVWCSTLNGHQGGVWQSGAGLAADDQGNVYLMTGNGDFGAHAHNYGESFVKLSCKDLSVLDSFTPWYWQTLNIGDKDLGSSGPLWISGTDYIVGAGKLGVLYSLNRNNMGGVGDPATKTDKSVDEVQATGDPPHPNLDHDHHVHGTPVYWQPLGRLYLWGENDVLKVFSIDRTSGHFSRAPVATGTVVAPSGMPGGMLSLSANGTADDIVWAVLPLNGDANTQRLVDGVLRAFDATNLREIWNSDNAVNQLGHFAKFAAPTVANGRVYVPTYDGKLVVYGLA